MWSKLFGSILDSTVWRESKETKIVWITLMAMRDRAGCIYASVPGLADRARVTLPECEDALRILSSPDKYSRSKEEEGRRIRSIEGGWQLVNHEKYADMMTQEDARAYWAEQKRKARAKLKAIEDKKNGIPMQHPLPGETAYVKRVEDGTEL